MLLELARNHCTICWLQQKLGPNLGECQTNYGQHANFALVLTAMGPEGLISILCYSNFLGGIF